MQSPPQVPNRISWFLASAQSSSERPFLVPDPVGAHEVAGVRRITKEEQWQWEKELIDSDVEVEEEQAETVRGAMTTG